MRRAGKYTKNSKVKSARFNVRKYFLWFHNMKLWQKIAVIVGPIVALLILIPFLTYLYFARDIADQERLMNRNNTGVVLLDRSGEVIYEVGRAQHREMLAIDQVGPSTVEALLASEDRNLYEHDGFSILSTLRAVYGYVLGGGSGFGGSTLTQQLAKITVLSQDRSFMRQFQTLSIAVAIENHYTKDQILEMYLNSAFFGGNAFGIEEAARTIFNKAPHELTLAESAMIIGVLPSPNNYSPVYGDVKLAKERQKTVLDRMVRNEFITQAERDEALAQELTYAEPESLADDSPAPHFVEMAMAELNEKYGEEEAARSGFQVKTTLDLGMQRQLQESINANMGVVRANGGTNAGGVAIEPNSGAIRALVGSYDWNDEEFGKVNIVTANRQPGSSFKPLYYAEAMAEGVVSPATILEDTPTDFNGYQPQNAMRNFNGDVSVRQALSWSLNIPAVKVMQRLGVEKAVAAAQRMGVTTINDDQDYGLSLALGAAEAKLLDMTHAYAGFANGGDQQALTYVEEVRSKYDDPVAVEARGSTRIISEQGAYLISNVLADGNARAGMFGSSLNVSNRQVAVKTGTTDANRDAWTIGYTPQLALGVWVGNNDNRQMSSGGGAMAGPIWRGFMEQALPAQNGDPFARPSGVVERDVCYGTGRLASHAGENTYKEVFLSSALPPVGCDVRTKEEEATEPEDTKPPEEETVTPETAEEDETDEPEEPEEPEEPVDPPEEEDPENPGNDGGDDGTTPPQTPGGQP